MSLELAEIRLQIFLLSTLAMRSAFDHSFSLLNLFYEQHSVELDRGFSRVNSELLN